MTFFGKIINFNKLRGVENRTGNKLKRCTALLLVTIILLPALAGCAEIRVAPPLPKDTLIVIDEVECSLAEAMFRLMEVKEIYRADEDEVFWERKIGDVNIAQYVKDAVLEEMTRATAAGIMAGEMAVYLTADECDAYLKEAEDAYNEISGSYDLRKYGITLDDVSELYRKMALYDKVFAKLSDDVTLKISQTDTKVIEVNYVELPANMSINEAEALRKEVKSGTSFETACRAAGYEPFMNCVLMKGDMPEAFENVAYALLDKELSEIVETKECLYIIQSVEDYMVTESVANNNKVLAAARKERFDTAYEAFAAEKLLRTNLSKWNKINVPEL